jgi:hypothetical protein
LSKAKIQFTTINKVILIKMAGLFKVKQKDKKLKSIRPTKVADKKIIIQIRIFHHT